MVIFSYYVHIRDVRLYIHKVYVHIKIVNVMP